MWFLGGKVQQRTVFGGGGVVVVIVVPWELFQVKRCGEMSSLYFNQVQTDERINLERLLANSARYSHILTV
jgi:hypothetical protein